MNAKEEFLRHTNSTKVKCVLIEHVEDKFILTTGYDNHDLEKFLDKIDFEYDSGYGLQNLFGTIWYEDGTWSSRGEYDGSEWWEHNYCPEIPKELIRIDKERDLKINMILDEKISKK
jgi:hypothetical protein